jgi:hypothetical protein
MEYVNFQFKISDYENNHKLTLTYSQKKKVQKSRVHQTRPHLHQIPTAIIIESKIKKQLFICSLTNFIHFNFFMTWKWQNQ